MDMQDYIDLFKKEYHSDELFESPECNAVHLCKEMGFHSMDQLVGTLLQANRIKFNKILQSQEIIDMMNNQIAQLEYTIEKLRNEFGASNHIVHNIKASHRKNTTEKKASPFEVAVYMNMKMPDKEIMDRLNISRTTLWRIKKEIESMGGVKEVMKLLPF